MAGQHGIYAKKQTLTDTAGDFSTPDHYTKKESFVVVGDEYGGESIFVEMDLSQLADGEYVVINDYTKTIESDQPKSLTYFKKNGNLQLLDKSYNVRRQAFQTVSYTNLQFKSTSGRVFIMFKGKTIRNYGGISGSYRRYSHSEMEGRCTKESLPPSSSLMCEDDFAGLATSCTGNFQCPQHTLATGMAVCQYNTWQMVCLPTEKGWNIYNSKCLESTDQCPLDTTYFLSAKNFDEDAIDGDGETREMSPNGDGGRSVNFDNLKAQCNRLGFCQPKKAKCMDHFPSDLTNRHQLMRFIRCKKCVEIWNCDFSKRNVNQVHG